MYRFTPRLGLFDTIQMSEGLQSAHIQADAAVQAAVITADATIRAGYMTLGAALTALIGAAVAWRAATASTRSNEEIAKNNRLAERERVAAAYIGEIESVIKFLDENDVISTLRARSDTAEIIRFHPGNSWLRSYDHDPSSVGLLNRAVAVKISYFCSRMWNEIGRLAWLNGLDPTSIPSFNTVKYQQDCANTLDSLIKLGKDILSELKAGILSRTS
jgi:hypothetical protein